MIQNKLKYCGKWVCPKCLMEQDNDNLFTDSNDDKMMCKRCNGVFYKVAVLKRNLGGEKNYKIRYGNYFKFEELAEERTFKHECVMY